MSNLVPEIIASVLRICDAIRSGEKGTTGTVQDVSMKVRRALDTPDKDVINVMFNAVEEQVGSYMRTHVGDVLITAEKESGKKLFHTAAELNRSLKTMEWAVRFIFNRLDTLKRTGVLNAADIPYAALRDTFVQLKDRLFESLEARMNEMRDGDALSRESIRSVVDFIRNVNTQLDKANRVVTAEHNFAKLYCASVKNYYRVKSEEMLARNTESLIPYAQWAGRRINEEHELLKELNMGKEWDKLKEALHTSLVRDGFVAIVRDPEGGLAKELDRDQDVSDLYALLELITSDAKPFEGIKQVAETYKEFAERRVISILSQPAPPPEPVPEGQKPKPPRDPKPINFDAMMAFVFKHIQQVWSKQFRGNTTVLNAFMEGVKIGIKKEDANPTLMSGYIHGYFCKLPDDELSEQVISDLFVLKNAFNSIASKDEFIMHYHNHLANRLLKSGFRRNVESRFITEIKSITGNADVYPFNMMINDLDASAGLTKTFTEIEAPMLAVNKIKPTFMICTTQNWPTQEAFELTLPPQLKDVIGRFDSMYRGKFSNRNIIWRYALSNASVNVAFKSGVKEFSGVLRQAVALLAIDGTTGLTASQLAAVMGTDVQSACEVLVSVANRTNLVVPLDADKKPVHKPIPPQKDAPAYILNDQFKNPSRKIVLPQVPRATASAGRVIVPTDKIEWLRNERTKWTIVRYMKSRGEANYQDMTDAVVRDLRAYFDAQPRIVKSMLDVLIADGFVERHEDDMQRLIYIS